MFCIALKHGPCRLETRLVAARTAPWNRSRRYANTAASSGGCVVSRDLDDLHETTAHQLRSHQGTPQTVHVPSAESVCDVTVQPRPYDWSA